jgi:hypothetical protein
MKINELLNYEQLCEEVLKEKAKKGNPRKSQMKQIESLCKVEKEGRKYIIKEIYQTPKEIVDGRKNNGSVSKYKDDLRPIIIDMLSREFKKDDDMIILTSSKIMKFFMGNNNPTFLKWKNINNIEGDIEKLATLEFISTYKDRVWKATNTVLNNLKLESYIGINEENVVVVYNDGTTKIASIKLQRKLVNVRREVLKQLAKEKGWDNLKINQLKKYNLWHSYNEKLKEGVKEIDETISYFYEGTIIVVGNDFSKILLDQKERISHRDRFNELTYDADCKSAEVDSKRNSIIKGKDIDYYKQKYINDNDLHKIEKVFHQFGLPLKKKIPLEMDEINEEEFEVYKKQLEAEKYYEYYGNRMEILRKTYEYIEEHLEEIDEVFCKSVYIEIDN